MKSQLTLKNVLKIESLKWPEKDRGFSILDTGNTLQYQLVLEQSVTECFVEIVNAHKFCMTDIPNGLLPDLSCLNQHKYFPT